jgi:hypothetical protein
MPTSGRRLSCDNCHTRDMSHHNQTKLEPYKMPWFRSPGVAHVPSPRSCNQQHHPCTHPVAKACTAAVRSRTLAHTPEANTPDTRATLFVLLYSCCVSVPSGHFDVYRIQATTHNRSTSACGIIMPWHRSYPLSPSWCRFKHELSATHYEWRPRVELPKSPAPLLGGLGCCSFLSCVST